MNFWLKNSSLFIKKEQRPPPSINMTMKLFMLSLLVLVPMYGLVIYTNIEQRNSATEYASIEGKSLLKNLNQEFENIIEGTDILLRGIAQSKEIHAAPDECSQFLANVLINYKRYLNLEVANLYGDAICGALPIERKTNFSSHSFFKGVLGTGQFSVGRFRIGSTTKNATIYLGYPIRNVNNEIEKVVYASLDLAWLADRLKTVDLPPETIFSAFDKDGTLLVHYPDQKEWIGKNNKPVLDAFKEKRVYGDLFETAGIDGVSRLYSLVSLGGTAKEEEEEESPVYLSLGFSHEFIFDRANDTLKRNITGLILVTLVALALVYFAGKSLIVKRFETLQELDRLKGEFISIASHQLRTPLTTVSWYAERLMAGDAGKVTEKQNSYLNEVHTNSQKMVELVSNFLNISRIELDTMITEFEPINVVLLAKSVIAEQESQINQKGLKLISTFEENIPKINTDAKLLRIVFQNLLSNAVKYTPDRGRVEFAITLGDDDKNIQIKVSDNGYGISMDQQDRIFTKFFRANNIKKVDANGIGLGLYVVKSIVERFGGKVWFESEENQGAIFYVTLPFDTIGSEIA